MEKVDRTQVARKSSRINRTRTSSARSADPITGTAAGDTVNSQSPTLPSSSREPATATPPAPRRSPRRPSASPAELLSTGRSTAAATDTAASSSELPHRQPSGSSKSAKGSPPGQNRSGVGLGGSGGGLGEQPRYPYRLRARASDQSEVSSSGTSQRAWSPISAPATPATVHSVATSVSLAAERDEEAEPEHDSVEGKARANKGKARAIARSEGGRAKATGGGQAGQVNQKRRSSSSHASPPPEPPTKRQRQNAPAGTSSRRYPLRPKPAMAPPRKSSASAPSVKTKVQAGTKSRASRTLNAVPTPSCSRSSDNMDIDGQDGLMGVDFDTLNDNFTAATQDEERVSTAIDTDAIDDEEMLSNNDLDDGDEDAERIEELSRSGDDQDGEGFDDDVEDEEEGQFDEEEEDEDEEGLDDPYGEDEEGAGGFTSQLRAMAGYMSGLSGRFRTLLASIRDRRDPTSQLVALQELSEVLSISNEDTLAGYFPTETFVAELIYLMGGPKPARSAVSKGKSAEEIAEDQEAEDALLAISAAFENNSEIMLLACRCLANLIEAMPYAAHSVVSHGAIPVLNSKLVEIEFIDLAEQVLQTLEKISNEYPSAIVREGGLSAMLQYLDFFNIYVQRTAMNAAANCCRRLSAEHFDKAKDVMPIIQNVLSYSDQRLVESACRCIVRLTESYRHHGDLLEQLLTHDVVSAVNAILLPGSDPASNSTTISSAMYTDVLKALATAARISPTIAVTLLESNIVETLYVLLTGSSTSEKDSIKRTSVDEFMDTAASGPSGAAIAIVSADGAEGVGMADVAVLQNLAQRPKEQVQEALTLIAELLPPLPRDGIFNGRMYTERALLKRRARAGRRQESSSSTTVKPQSSSSPSTPDVEKSEPSKPERVKAERELAKEQAQLRRVSALREKSDLVRRFTELVLPTLVEVYAASVGWSVRSKALYGILKLVNFVEGGPLLNALDTVPLASFIASVLSSRDHAILVQGALQLVELLTTKLPDVYSALLRREGVMWEIEDIAAREPSAKPLAGVKDIKEKDKPESKTSAAADAEMRDTSTATPPISSEEATRAAPSSVVTSLPPSNLSRLLAATNALSGAAILTGIAPHTASSQNANTITTLAGHVVSANDAEDSNIWRARILCDMLSPEASDASAGGADEAGRALSEIKGLVGALRCDSDAESQETLRDTLDQIANLFCKPSNPISSFEMVRSGLIDGLHDFSTGDSDLLPNEVRCNMLIDAFMRDHGHDGKTNVAAAALVRRLQETLSRLEDVEIMTTIYNEDDARRSPTANVARQVRLKLVADKGEGEDEIPRSSNNIVVSIHAITSFRSLHDYLRPKIAASQALSGSSLSSSLPRSLTGLSGMLETLASSAGIEMSAALREHLRAAASASGAASNDGGARAEGGADGAAKVEKKTGGRRRSSRLSLKSGDQTREAEETDVGKPSAHDAGEGEMDAALAQRLVEGLMEEDMEGDNGFSDGFEDGFVMDDDDVPGLGAPDLSVTGDETIHLDVTPEEGSTKKESTTASQTEFSSLSQSAPTALSSMSSPSKDAAQRSSSRASYASALQKKPMDWHLEFEMDDRKLGLDSTIYSAIHRQEMHNRARSGHAQPVPGRPSWANLYTVKFRKVAGPEPKSTEDEVGGEDELSKLRTPDMGSIDAPYVRILQLLRVFYNLNRGWRETRSTHAAGEFSAPLNESAYVNNKLTAKLNRQLEEPMIVASKCLPTWSLILPRRYPFLFPFEARYAFLQSTSFGYHRLISRWQTRQSRNQDGAGAASNARTDDSLALLGRLTRQKVRISRNNILASASKVFELYGANSSLLEVEYFDEVGTGLGPTLEFYAMVSKDFAKKSTNMWRVDESRDWGKSEYVSTFNGLFPAPIDHQDVESAEGKSRVQLFRVLGQFVAKAQFDSRIVDLNFSSLFMRAILGQAIPCTLDMLRKVDEALARSLEKLRAMPAEDLHGLMLDFTMPGYEAYELHPGGRQQTVTSANVEQYIDEVVTHSLETGIRPLVDAFQAGFNLIFPISAMYTFTPEELVMLFGNQEEDWDEKTLLATIKPDHGYNADSPTFRNVIAVMSSFSATERRDFLQWLTGSPKLPVGGFTGLHPQLTIVKRPPDANQTADQTLPSVMTCVNFCKMPPFSTREVMRERLLLAMREGQASFHLS